MSMFELDPTSVFVGAMGALLVTFIFGVMFEFTRFKKKEARSRENQLRERDIKIEDAIWTSKTNEKLLRAILDHLKLAYRFEPSNGLPLHERKIILFSTEVGSREPKRKP